MQQDKGTKQKDGEEIKELKKHIRAKSQNASTAGFIATIIVNFTMLYLANNLLNWNISFLTSSFIAPLYVFNISIVATIIANFIFIFIRMSWFRHLLQTALNLIGFGAMYTLYVVFPFDFYATSYPAWQNIIHIVILVGLILSGLAVIFEFVQIFTSQNRCMKKE